MLSEICGAEESLLLGGNGGEVHRSFWRRFRVRPHARHFQQDRAAGCIIDRTVVDRISAFIRAADAEMIVVRRVNDALVAKLRIAAGEFRDDVRRVERANRAGDCAGEFVSERDGFEIARRGGLRERVEFVSGSLEEIGSSFLRNP